MVGGIWIDNDNRMRDSMERRKLFQNKAEIIYPMVRLGRLKLQSLI